MSVLFYHLGGFAMAGLLLPEWQAIFQSACVHL